MKTKGMKIIDNIARTFKRPMELDDIVRASNDARSTGRLNKTCFCLIV